MLTELLLEHRSFNNREICCLWWWPS